MRAVRIYQPGLYRCGEEFELSADAAQHVGVVLRMQPGQQIILFCGDNREFEAIITAVHKKKVVVSLATERVVNRESPKMIHLAQAISKGERMEFVVQKAVELGVVSITPLMTARSVVKLDKDRLEKKRAQWQAIAVCACEQSGRNQVPVIAAALSLDDYLQKEQASLKFVLSPAASKTWRDYSFVQRDIALLIGPEGGFSPTESERLFSFNFNPLCLGPRVLRTETAAIAAISVLQAVSGDL